MLEDNCIFCKIVKGGKENFLWESKDNIALLDVNPQSKGHMLIIPKKHSRWVWDMKKEDYGKLMDDTYYMAGVLKKAFDTEWVEQVVAGVGVEHTHVHLLPRQFDDGLGELPKGPLEPKPSEEEMKEIFDKINAAL